MVGHLATEERRLVAVEVRRHRAEAEERWSGFPALAQDLVPEIRREEIGFASRDPTAARRSPHPHPVRAALERHRRVEVARGLRLRGEGEARAEVRRRCRDVPIEPRLPPRCRRRVGRRSHCCRVADDSARRRDHVTAAGDRGHGRPCSDCCDSVTSGGDSCESRASLVTARDRRIDCQRHGHVSADVDCDVDRFDSGPVDRLHDSCPCHDRRNARVNHDFRDVDCGHGRHDDRLSDSDVGRRPCDRSRLARGVREGESRGLMVHENEHRNCCLNDCCLGALL